MRLKSFATLLLLLAFATPAARAQGGRVPDYSSVLSAPVVGGYTYQEEMVAGGDSVRLLTRIYLPEGEVRIRSS